MNQFLSETTSKFSTINLPNDINHDEWFEAIKNFISKHNNSSLDVKQLNGLSSVFYVLIGILIDQKITNIPKGFKLQSETEMSIGAGVGSSASFGVCLAGVFYNYSK